MSRFSSVLITAALALLLLGSGYKDNIDVYDGGAKIMGRITTIWRTHIFLKQ
ncbi:MAG: hypothetical protein WBL88_13540 [Nitrososphaeraceae archaeon]